MKDTVKHFEVLRSPESPLKISIKICDIDAEDHTCNRRRVSKQKTFCITRRVHSMGQSIREDSRGDWFRDRHLSH